MEVLSSNRTTPSRAAAINRALGDTERAKGNNGHNEEVGEMAPGNRDGLTHGGEGAQGHPSSCVGAPGRCPARSIVRSTPPPAGRLTLSVKSAPEGVWSSRME